MLKREGQWLERENYVKLIQDKINSFKGGSERFRNNILLLGQPKAGKTTVIKQILQNQKEIKSVYIDFNKLGLSPESFSIEFIGNICFNILGKDKSDYKRFLDINHLLTLKNELSATAFGIIKLVENEVSKIKPNQRFLVESALKFAEEIAAKNKFLVAMENIEAILDLNNFLQIKDVASIIKFNQRNVMYIATSSALTLAKNSFKDFENIDISNFNFSEMESFLKILAVTDKKSIEKLHSLSNGNPYIALCILKRDVHVKNIEKSFIAELLEKDGLIYNYCCNCLENFLKRTSGHTLSKIILKVIAFEEGLRLSEIASRIYRSAPVTKALLERLIASDIIYKKDGRYYFYDSVLRLWLKLIAIGYEIDDEISEEKFDEVRKLL